MMLVGRLAVLCSLAKAMVFSKSPSIIIIVISIIIIIIICIILIIIINTIIGRIAVAARSSETVVMSRISVWAR